LAGNVGSRFGGEECNGGGDLRRQSRPTHRGILPGDTFGFRGGAGFDPAGPNCVNSDSFTGNLERKLRVSPTIPALAALYAVSRGLLEIVPVVDAMLTMRPYPEFSIAGRTAFVTLNAVFRLIAML
jgi:hypothetical protein